MSDNFGWKYYCCIYWILFKSFEQNKVDRSFPENAGSDEFHYGLFDGRNKIVKAANNKLLKQLENTERQCSTNAQYSWRECVEVAGIPKSIESKDLEHTACKVFSSIGFDIGQDRIEACHRLTKSDRTIVRFSLRKGCQYLMHIKKRLKDLNPTNLSFPDSTKIYVNDSLCSYYSRLWNECKTLWNNKNIFSYFTVNVTVKIKQAENGLYNGITHVNNLRAIFSEEHISMPWIA